MTSEKISVLLIEDDPEDRFFLQRLLAEPGWPASFDLSWAESLKEGLEKLARGGVDIVLLDLMLPDSQGLPTVIEARRRSRDVPIVVLTGMSDEKLGLDAMRNGAQDYLVKGNADARALKRSLSYAVWRHRQIRKEERLKAEIHERRRMEKLKDELISIISHEMRNPLTIIKAAICNLRDSLAGTLPEPQAEMLWIGERGVQRLQKIVDHILNLSRLESGKAQINPEPVDLAGLIRELVAGLRLVAGYQKIALLVEAPAGLPPAYADPSLVMQVLSNLLDNAMRFARSKILIKTQIASDKRLEVSVSDDGPGIPADRMGDLFSKFIQVNRRARGEGYQGTGLGLAICKEIIERQNGKIWAECPKGGGTCFRFRLPQGEASCVIGQEES